MLTQLSTATLDALEGVTTPAYARELVTSGILHLGIGGFHRAHQAVYTDDLLALGHSQWGITGVSLRSPTARDALVPQDGLYTVQTLGSEPAQNRVIGSILDILTLAEPGHLEQIVATLADPATQVVTLTITEKGYCANGQGELDLEHLDVRADIANPQAPRSAPGVLALGLIERARANAGPLTILSCDNLSNNGAITTRVVLGMLQQMAPEAEVWANANLSFPSSMVDRIVPQTTPENLAQFATTHNYSDHGLTVCEPYSQWVIEDRFAGARPAWDLVGVQFVDKVAPFEQAKLRLLNATHSALAYLGLLAGYEYVHQALADPSLAKFTNRLMSEEILPVVTCPQGMDLAAYKTSILKRFANSAVPYRTSQVATDGSQKLAQRIFPTINDQLAQNGQVTGLCLVVAGWLRCLERWADDGSPISISDPAAESIRELIAQHSEPEPLVQAIAQTTRQFGQLSGNAKFLSTLASALTNIRTDGSLASSRTV